MAAPLSSLFHPVTGSISPESTRSVQAALPAPADRFHNLRCLAEPAAREVSEFVPLWLAKSGSKGGAPGGRNPEGTDRGRSDPPPGRIAARKRNCRVEQEEVP